MKYIQFNSNFQEKSFLKFIIAKDKACSLDWKERIVSSHLVYRSKYGGDNYLRISKATGLDRQAVKNAMTELVKCGLAELAEGSDWTWISIGEPIGNGFCKVFIRSNLCPLTLLDNLILSMLINKETSAKPFYWNKKRHAVLANYLGAETWSIRRCIDRLVKLKIINKDWSVNIDAINPDWFLDQPSKKKKIAGADNLVNQLAPDDPPSTYVMQVLATKLGYTEEQVDQLCKHPIISKVTDGNVNVIVKAIKSAGVATFDDVIQVIKNY